MSRRLECIITGCELAIQDEPRFVHGDLHKLDGVFIFNAIVDSTMEPRWQDGVPGPNEKVLWIINQTHMFDRRGVFIVPVEAADLSPPAEAYIIRSEAPKIRHCRHYSAVLAPELGAGWLRCPDCGREYDSGHVQDTKQKLARKLERDRG